MLTGGSCPSAVLSLRRRAQADQLQREPPLLRRVPLALRGPSGCEFLLRLVCVCVFVPLGPRFRLVDSFAYFARCPLQNLKVPVPEAVAAELGEAIEL